MMLSLSYFDVRFVIAILIYIALRPGGDRACHQLYNTV